MKITSTPPSTPVIQGLSSIQQEPQPLVLPAPIPIPAHCPSLADLDVIDETIHRLIKKLTTITSFLIPWDVHYEIDKQAHLTKLENLRAELHQLGTLSQAAFDDILDRFAAARITFMLHDTLLGLAPGFANEDATILNTYKDKIYTASESSWQILADSLIALLDIKHLKNPEFLSMIRFQSIRSAVLHQLLSYDNAKIQQDHFLRFQNHLIDYINSPNVSAPVISHIQKELQLPVLNLYWPKDLEKDQIENIKNKILNKECLISTDLQNLRYLRTKNANKVAQAPRDQAS
jgi:hypothetical protein